MAGGWRRAAAGSTAILAILGALALGGCSGRDADTVDYAIDGRLPTYNTTTVAGAASGGPQAFARTLTGFGYHGPDGQVIADHDFGTISVAGRTPLILDYQIADAAVYSDGRPVTCDDLVLAWAAQSGRYPGFDAANRAGYADVARIDCSSGQRKARVSFAQDRGFVAYEELFTATSMMPSHVLADQLGVNVADVTAALVGDDAAMVDRIAELWNTTWSLNAADFDPKRFPSSGPYKIDAVLDGGAVVLVANDRWWGLKPATRQITVWPAGQQTTERVGKAEVEVVDVAAGSLGPLSDPDAYQSSTAASGGIQQLIFAPAGPLADVSARRALALCTPRDAIAQDAGVPVADSRLYAAADDAYGRAERPEVGQFAASDPDAAREALGGQPLTVRVGYQRPNARLAAVTAAIAAACAPAGITVTDAATDDTGPRTLTEGRIDVLLAGTGGAAGGGSSGSSAMDAYALHSGNGNNLSGYANGQIDGIIAALAITVDPAELARLLAESVPVLWTELPTLPLYRQQRTLLLSPHMHGVSGNPSRWGAGWNMDRWVCQR